MESFVPRYGTFLVYQLDAVRTVASLNDPILTAAAAEIQSHKYIGYIFEIEELPLPDKPDHKCCLAVVGQGLCKSYEEAYVDSSMCIPIFPATDHPLQRDPLRPEPLFPFDGCYQHNFVTPHVRIPTRPYDHTNATSLTTDDAIKAMQCVNEDRARMWALEKAQAGVQRQHTGGSRSSDDSPHKNHVPKHDLSLHCAGDDQEVPLTPEHLSLGAPKHTTYDASPCDAASPSPTACKGCRNGVGDANGIADAREAARTSVEGNEPMIGSAQRLQPAPGSYQAPPQISGDHPAIQDESISDGKINTSESDKPFTRTADEPVEYQVPAETQSQMPADRVTHACEGNVGGQQHATVSSPHSFTPQDGYDAESEPSIIESDDDSMVGSELDMLPQVFLDDPLEDRHVVPLVTISFDLSEASSVRDPMGFLDEARELLRLIQESRSRSRARDPDRDSRSMYTQSTVTDTESWVDLAVEGKVTDVTQITQLKPRGLLHNARHNCRTRYSRIRRGAAATWRVVKAVLTCSFPGHVAYSSGDD